MSDLQGAPARDQQVAFNGYGGKDELPLPATYIVDSDGKVRVAFVQEDHMSRLDPDEIVSILKDWGAH